MAGFSINSISEKLGVEKSDFSLQSQKSPSKGTDGKNFSDHLTESLKEVNKMQTNADEMAQNISTGRTENLHETMLAITQADLSFNLMVQVRNKVLEAYQDVMRMPV
jgi:flagellar hook-basal body complex protein FliE